MFKVKELFDETFPYWKKITPRDIKKYQRVSIDACTFEMKIYNFPSGCPPLIDLIKNLQCRYNTTSFYYGICVDIRQFDATHATLAVTIVVSLS